MEGGGWVQVTLIKLGQEVGGGGAAGCGGA